MLMKFVPYMMSWVPHDDMENAAFALCLRIDFEQHIRFPAVESFIQISNVAVVIQPVETIVHE